MPHIKILFFVFAVVFAILVKAEPGKYCKEPDANGGFIIKPCVYELPNDSDDPTPEPIPPKPTAPKVDIYYASWDPYSDKAIRFFRDHHIVVNAFDIEFDHEAAARKKIIDPGFINGIPLVIINDGVPIRGVDEKKYREALRLPPQ